MDTETVPYRVSGCLYFLSYMSQGYNVTSALIHTFNIKLNFIESEDGYYFVQYARPGCIFYRGAG